MRIVYRRRSYRGYDPVDFKTRDDTRRVMLFVSAAIILWYYLKTFGKWPRPFLIFPMRKRAGKTLCSPRLVSLYIIMRLLAYNTSVPRLQSTCNAYKWTSNSLLDAHNIVNLLYEHILVRTCYVYIDVYSIVLGIWVVPILSIFFYLAYVYRDSVTYTTATRLLYFHSFQFFRTIQVQLLWYYIWSYFQYSSILLLT